MAFKWMLVAVLALGIISALVQVTAQHTSGWRTASGPAQQTSPAAPAQPAVTTDRDERTLARWKRHKRRFGK